MVTEYKVSQNSELIGGMLQTIWTAFPEAFQKILKKILADHGIGEIVPDKWYHFQSVLNALKEIEEKFGHHLMRQVGEQAAMVIPVPPEITTLKQCLLSLNVTLSRICRGGEIGGYTISEEKTSAGFTRYIVNASTPFPCSLTMGYLDGFAQRFKQGEFNEVITRHDEERPCRREGAESCTYLISCW
jgi:hypothetical protein